MERDGVDDLDLIVLNVMDEKGWRDFSKTMGVAFGKELGLKEGGKTDAEAFASSGSMFERFKWGMAFVAPRGIGPTAWKAKTNRVDSGIS